MKFEDIKRRIEEILKSYDCIKILKYEDLGNNEGVFLVGYKKDVVGKYSNDLDTDVFTYDIWFDCEDIDLVDCNGYGFDHINAKSPYRSIKAMFDQTFSNESVEYNIKAYYGEV